MLNTVKYRKAIKPLHFRMVKPSKPIKIKIMKKLVGILALILFVSVGLNAQEKKNVAKKKPKMTSEQIATLQSKKMALELDLDAKQQEAVYSLYKKNAENRLKMRESAMQKRKAAMEARKEGMQERTKDMKKRVESNRFEAMNAQLDNQIAQKEEMKKILNEKQFEKWSKMQKARLQKEGQRRNKVNSMQKRRKTEMARKRGQRSRTDMRRN